MARRIDRYKVSPGDDIGDPDYLTERFEDIDNRIHTQELKGQSIDERADELERVALSRLDDVFTGVLRDAQAKLQDTGAWFKAESQTAFDPDTGSKRFILTEATRGGYVPTRDILFVSSGDETHFMVGQLVTYLPLDGALDVTISEAFGGDEKSDWLIYPLAPGYADHLARIDNPHNVTAEQVGTYTQAEIDQAIEDAKDDIRSGASGALDTLGEIEAELNSGSSARAALISQVSNKLDKSGGTMTGNLVMSGAGLELGDGFQLLPNIGTGNKGMQIHSGVFNDYHAVDGDMRMYNNNQLAMIYGGDGIVRQPNKPSFSCAVYGTNSASASIRPVLIGSVIHNTGNHFNSATGRFTAPVLGNYCCLFHGFATSQDSRHIMTVNGVIRRRTISDGGTYNCQVIAFNINLSAGDYVEIKTLGNHIDLHPDSAYSTWSINLL